jgi:hypothetical protein
LKIESARLSHPRTSSEPGPRALAICHSERDPHFMTSCLNGKDLTMSRQFLITAATWTLLGTMTGRAGSPGPDVRTAGLDLRSLAAHSAKVDFIPGTTGAV